MRTGAIIYPILSNNASLTALVPAASIFALRAEQPTSTSYIVYREISSIPLNTTGDSTSLTVDPRLRQRSILDINTVQISCFASTYLEVENIAVEVRNALDREWGSVPSPYHNDVYVDSIVYDSAVDDYDDDYGDRGVYMKHLDFTIRVVRVNQGYANQYEMFFDGVDEYLSATSDPVFTPNNSAQNRGFSISLWFRGLPENQGYTGLIEKVLISPLTLEYSFYLNSYGQPELILWGNNNLLEYLRWTMDDSVFTGAWHHIVVTWDLEDTEDSMTGYINGIMYEVDEGNTTFTQGTAWSSITADEAPLTLGRYFGVTYNEQWIDEVSIYDNELSQADVNSLYNSGFTGAASEIDYLLAWWRMGDTLGTLTYPTIEDASSNTNELTMENMYSGNIGTVVPSGPFPNLYALSFDGVDEYLSIPNNTALSPVVGGGFTIMVWVKVPQVATATLILNKSNTAYNPEYVVQIQPGGKPKIFFYGNLDGAIYQALQLNQELAIDTWYHIAFTFDNFAAGIVGYIDGQYVAGTTSSVGVWSPTINGLSPLWVARGNGGVYYESKVDELAIFNYIISGATIATIYNNGQPLDLSFFKNEALSYQVDGWWRMGDTIGTATFPIIEDASSNSNDATMNNMLASDITTDVP